MIRKLQHLLLAATLACLLLGLWWYDPAYALVTAIGGFLAWLYTMLMARRVRRFLRRLGVR